MQETCCQGQHMHLHAQLLLTQLGRLPGGARFARLAPGAGGARRQGAWGRRLADALLVSAPDKQACWLSSGEAFNRRQSGDRRSSCRGLSPGSCTSGECS